MPQALETKLRNFKYFIVIIFTINACNKWKKSLTSTEKICVCVCVTFVNSIFSWISLNGISYVDACSRYCYTECVNPAFSPECDCTNFHHFYSINQSMGSTNMSCVACGISKLFFILLLGINIWMEEIREGREFI